MKRPFTLILIFLLFLSSVTACRAKGSAKSIIQDYKTGEELRFQDFEASYAFGKSFLNDYYLQKAGKAKIDFSKYIINENLLKYSNGRISREPHIYDIKEVNIGINEAKLIPEEKCFYISYVALLKYEIGSCSESVEILVSYINGKFVISDWYIPFGAGSSSFDQVYRPNATIDSPGIWDDQAYVKSLFEKAGI